MANLDLETGFSIVCNKCGEKIAITNKVEWNGKTYVKYFLLAEDSKAITTDVGHDAEWRSITCKCGNSIKGEM